MALTFLFLFIILKPTADVEVLIGKRETAQLPPDLQAQLTVSALRKLSAVISGAFLDYWAPSVLFVALAGAWCFMRRRFLAFALPVGAMIALYSFYGAPHHQGTAFVAAIAAMWIAWPTAEEQRAFGMRERWATHGVIALLLCLCAVNIWDSVVVIQRERLYPYSGAEDAAKYLKSVGADRGPIFGFLYGIVGVQAYFDHNILANIPTAYFHHGLPLAGNAFNVAELQRVNPEYLVAYTTDPEWLVQLSIPQYRAQGYEMVHASDGYLLYKRTVFERQVYFIFRRTRPRAGQAPAQAQN